MKSLKVLHKTRVDKTMAGLQYWSAEELQALDAGLHTLLKQRERDATKTLAKRQTRHRASPVRELPQVVEERKSSSVPLREAVHEVGQGRDFVRIHRVREALGWDRERFDTALKEAVRAYHIELHGGDPSTLSDQEFADCLPGRAGSGVYHPVLAWTRPTVWGRICGRSAGNQDILRS